MSEEAPENYNSGDVVWVKLGSSWWPGEVKDIDELPNDVVDFKKPPLVIVKFFDEDSYEYVKTWANIFPFNSEKKNDFIKKGMAAFRAKVPHMEKFPKDVLTAEVRVGGNPNILSEPMFLPEKKRNYAAEVFGTPSPKKTNKEKKRSSSGKSSQKDTAHITHRRFLGVDDYRAYICIQYPGKDRVPGDREDEEVLRINREPEQEFNCHSCSFTTKRLEVMILHTKSHIQGVYVSSPRKTKHPAARRRKDKMKKSRSSDDMMDSDSSSSDGDYVREKKKKLKAQSARKAKAKKAEVPKEESKTSSDIRSTLLAVWDDSDEDEEFDLTLNTTTGNEKDLSQSITDIILGKTPTSEEQKETDTTVNDEKETTDADSTLNKTNDELDTSSELKEKLTSQDIQPEPEVTDGSKLESKGDDVQKAEEYELTVEKPTIESLVTDSSVSDLDAFNKPEEVMADKVPVREEAKDPESSKNITVEATDAETSIEEMSSQKMDKDIQDAIKSCFDFDEDEEDDGAVLGKTAAGRKIPRVIPPAEKRKSQDTPDSDDVDRERILKEAGEFNKRTVAATRREDVDATFKELMEMTSVPELPDIQNTLKCEQNFHNIKTIKFPDKPESIGPSKSEKKEASDVATKLINPKKRFVKSFEDFELMQNEIRRKEEEARSEAVPEEAKVDDAKVEEEKKVDESKVGEAKMNTIFNKTLLETMTHDDDLREEVEVDMSKLKSKIMSKIIEEAKINEENKTKIMSKIHNSPKPKVEELAPARSNDEVRRTSHRTPRSKILELYRNDANKQKAEEEQHAEKAETHDAVSNRKEKVENRLKEARNEAVPPKKGKWSRRGSHPKKDRNAFLLGEVAVEDVQSRQMENDKVVPPVDIQTPLETSSSAVLEQNVSEDLEPVLTDADKENVTKEAVQEEKRDTLAPADTDKISFENVSRTEDSVEESVTEKTDKQKENVEVTNPAPLVELAEQVVAEEQPVVSETEKFVEEEQLIELSPINDTAIAITEKESESLPVKKADNFTENESESVKHKETKCLILNKRIEEGEKEEQLKDDSRKAEGPGSLPVDVETAKSSEDIATENVVPLPDDKILPLGDVDVLSEETITKNVEISPEEVVEETQKIEAEEPRAPSPIVDVVSPSSPIISRDAIWSPPKKSKKRKMSENFSIADTKDINRPSLNIAIDSFSPAEKKKKDTELGDNVDVKETILEKPEMGSSATVESVGKVPEHKTETNDVVAAKSGAATPKPAGDPVAEHNNEVEIQCGTSSPESFKFSIQTNLSNLTSREEISALALATLSEIKTDLEPNDSKASEEKTDKTVLPSAPTEPELVPIEGNLTVVSERDLADGQVEITTEQVISPKRPVTLSSFSMDFSDSASDSNSNSTNDVIPDFGKSTEFGSRGTEFGARGTEFSSRGSEFIARGTEFTPKAMTKQIKKVDRKKENAYERLELLNILEGNSDTEKKSKESLPPPKPKKSSVDDICDFEEHIPSQIVCAKQLNRDSIDREYPYTEKVKGGEKSTTSKLLERLTVSVSKAEARKAVGRAAAAKNQAATPTSIKIGKYVGKAKTAVTGKPVILSEQIVKSAPETPKGKLKKPFDDIEDVEAFVIHKDPKKIQEQEASDSIQSNKSAGKAKILQQTIITPAGEIIQPIVGQVQTDDNIFDINSMPIVLSDEILTPESIENMPIILGNEPKPVIEEKVTPRRTVPNRIITKATAMTLPQPVVGKNQVVVRQTKTPRILQTAGNKAIKNTPTLPNTSKPGKYIILPQSGVQAAKYVAKKSPVVKRTNIVPKSTAVTPEPSGNKIMIVTNQQGQQQRLLLTPAQQKMLGYQNQKVTKTLVKGNVMQKSVLAAKSVSMVEAGTSGLISKSSSLIGQKVVVGTSPSTGLLATTTQELITTQGRVVKGVTKKLHPMNQKVFSGTSKTQKTILIKNQHGQTVRKIQGTDDELLDKQVAEQLEAIKASSGIKFSTQPKQMESLKAKAPVRRSYSKKAEPKLKLAPPSLTSVQQPPKLEPSTTKVTVAMPKKPDPVEFKTTSSFVTEDIKPPQERPLNQLVIQDAVGNQTTITEGQILALPSETVDGQPQSYMLVTLDESGNLTPLNSEALMSLDPNLGLGGDLSNMVLQIDQGALTERPQPMAVKATVSSEPPKMIEPEPAPIPVPEAAITTEIAETVMEHKIGELPQTTVPSTNGDPGQQLIVTGDPIATQKFLDSLTEGTTDLANILANAEGNSILIQADGQQILINTNSDNQMLLSMNNDSLSTSESTEGGGNPIFATQPSKNQDILAAALADTDVFQQDQHAAQTKITSQLSPNNTLYPMNVGNVLETSLTLSSPIMTPLEVPSNNTKKIPDDEADILTQVPKNVDLPITITDPNISQTVANQQVASLLANDLQTNLELTLPATESSISSVSVGMNSPTYVYSLPPLDESVDIGQKPFNSSMPLLNEDVEESAVKKEDENAAEKDKEDVDAKPVAAANESFLDEEEGRFTLGGEMCSSLSEPPPEMFDLPEDNQSLLEKRNSNIPSSLQSTPDVSDNASKDGDTTDMSTQAESSNEGSCEIPLQPQIVAKSLDLSENLGSLKRSLQAADEDSKRCKFD